MKFALSTLLASIALLSPQALAMGGGSSIDLQYAVRNGEALYGVATANGELRFFNQGPSATKLRWFDPLRGEEETRVLHPGQALLSHGHFGVPISEGTVVLVEKAGPGPLSTGLASIPTSPQFRGCIPTDPCTLVNQQGEPNQMHDSVHCLHNNGAFLPWHRGYFASVDTLVGGTMCSIESYRGILGVLSSSSDEYNFLLGDGSVRFLGGQEGEPMHDSVHCFTQPVCGDDIFMPLPGVYDCRPNYSGGTDGDDIFMPNAQLDVEISSVIWTQTLNLEHGPGLHDSIHCIVGGTMCSMSSSNDPDSFTHHANLEKLLMIQTLELESGHPLPFAISLESFIVPTDGDDIFMPNADSFFAGIPSCPELEHGPGMHDSNHGWTPCPPYEPCDAATVISIWTAGAAAGIWTSGTASIWSDGTFSSLAPDGTWTGDN